MPKKSKKKATGRRTNPARSSARLQVAADTLSNSEVTRAEERRQNPPSSSGVSRSIPKQRKRASTSDRSTHAKRRHQPEPPIGDDHLGIYLSQLLQSSQCLLWWVGHRQKLHLHLHCLKMEVPVKAKKNTREATKTRTLVSVYLRVLPHSHSVIVQKSPPKKSYIDHVQSTVTRFERRSKY